jgi:hypothetical protein
MLNALGEVNPKALGNLAWNWGKAIATDEQHNPPETRENACSDQDVPSRSEDDCRSGPG